MSGLQNVRFTKCQVFKTSGCKKRPYKFCRYLWLVEMRRFCCSNVWRQRDGCGLFSILEGFLPYISIISISNLKTVRFETRRFENWLFDNLTFCKPDVLKPHVLKPDVLWVYPSPKFDSFFLTVFSQESTKCQKCFLYHHGKSFRGLIVFLNVLLWFAAVLFIFHVSKLGIAE